MVQSVTSGIRAVDPAARSTAPTYFYGGCPPATSDLYLYQQQPRPPPPPWPPLPPQQQGVWYLNQNQFQYHSPSPPPQQHQWDPPPPHGAHLPPPPGSFAPPPPPYYYPQSYHPQQLNQEGGAQSQQAWEYHFEAAHQLFDEIPERQSEAKFQVVEPAACVALSSMQAYNVTPEVQAFPVEFAAQISKLKASLDSVRNDLHALNAAITRGQALKGRSDESLSQTIEPDKPQSPNLEPQPQQESESIVEEEEEAVEPTLDDDEDYPHLAGDDVDTDAHVELEESGETLRFNLIKAEENFLSSAGSANPSEEASTVEKFCGSADVVTSSLNDDSLGDDDVVVVEAEFSGTEEDDERKLGRNVELLIAWYDSFLNVDTVFDQRPKDTLHTRYVHMSTANMLLQKLHKTHGPVFDAHSIYSMTFLVSRVDLGALHCDTALDFLKFTVGLKQLATSHPIVFGYAEKSWKHIISGIDQTSQNMKGKKDDMSTSMDAKLGVVHARARGADHGEHTKKYVKKERKSVDKDVRAEVIDDFITAEMLLGLDSIDFDDERKIRLEGRFGFMGFDSGGDESGAKGAPSSACASEKMPFPTFPLDVFQKRMVFTDGFASQSYEEIMLSLVAITGVPKSKCGKYLLEYHKYFEMGLYNFQAYHVGSNTSRRSISLVKVEGVSDAHNILMGHGEVEGRFICSAQSDNFIVDIEPDEHMKCARNESNAGIILLDNSNELTVMIDKSIVHNVSMVGESTHILYVAIFSRKDFNHEMAYQELKEKGVHRYMMIVLLVASCMLKEHSYLVGNIWSGANVWELVDCYSIVRGIEVVATAQMIMISIISDKVVYVLKGRNREDCSSLRTSLISRRLDCNESLDRG